MLQICHLQPTHYHYWPYHMVLDAVVAAFVKLQYCRVFIDDKILSLVKLHSKVMVVMYKLK